MALLSYLSDLKRVPGLAFAARFLRDFSIKYSLLNTLSLDKVQCHIFFPSQDIKQNVLLSSYLDNYWRHKLQNLSLIIL